MNENKVEVILLTSNKTGILSSIMMVGAKFGLMLVKNKFLKIDENNYRLFLFFNGKLNCSEYEFSNEITSHSEIYSVESIVLKYIDLQGDSSTKSDIHAVESNIVSTNLRAFDLITPESLQIAESKLLNLLGPIASILVESAARETKHIGDLFVLLSKELEGKERHDFLSLISGLNLNDLK